MKKRCFDLMRWLLQGAQSIFWRSSVAYLVWLALGQIGQKQSLNETEFISFLKGLSRAGILRSVRQDKPVGLDLESTLIAFAREVLGFSEVADVSRAEELQSWSFQAGFVPYEWILGLRRGPFPIIRVLRVSLNARRQQVPLVVALADTCMVRFSLYGELIARLSGGAVLLESNTTVEVRKYGFSRGLTNKLWTLPPSNLVRYQSLPAGERESVFLLPSGGNATRRQYTKALRAKLEPMGFRCVETDPRELDWDQYLQLISKSAGLATSSSLQEGYRKGPRSYTKKLPEWILTHRSLDALASGACLLTQETPRLRELGFTPGIHYVSLPNLEEVDLWHQVPTHEEMVQIGQYGRQHLFFLLRGQSL